MLIMDRDAFRVVYDVVVHGKKPRLEEGFLEECINVASKNKVLLHFLRVADIRSETRFREEAKYKRFLEYLRIVAEALDGLSYVFIKLRKPVVYVPSDIDVLIDRRHVVEAIARLVKKGFNVVVAEPYCVTMVRGDCIVDLYIYPTMGGVIYLDSEELFRHVERSLFNDIEVPVLRTYTEALMAIAHAVYKERIYTLNDYVTVKLWFSEKTLELAKKLRCLDAVSKALAIHRLVEEQSVVLPYRIPFAEWIDILRSKIVYDRLSRVTLLNIFKTLGDRRFGKLIVSKLTRETY